MRRTDAIAWERLLTLPPDDGLPLQTRLRQSLIRAVREGHLGIGAALPSSRTLANRLGIARNTVNAVYGQLAADGIVSARQRSGFFVATGGATTFQPGAASPTDPLPCAVPTDGHGPNWEALQKRTSWLRPALAKPAGWQSAPFPFVYGRHDSELFPTDEFRECFTQTLSRSRQPRWTPDLDIDDQPELIEQIRTRLLPRRGVFARADEILMTVGSQQAFHLLAEALFDHTTRLGLEDPGHPHARATFGLRAPRMTALPVDGQGLMLDALPPLDAVFVTPAQQSPTTVTMSTPRRERLLALARERDFIVIEDDYESGQERAQGAAALALKSLDRDGRVVLIGSLPKTLSPAMRLAYIVGPSALLAPLRRLRHAMVRHPSALLQQVYALFLSLGHHETHERKVQAVMRERIGILVRALQRHLPTFQFQPPDGGSAVWIQAPAWVDSDELARIGAQHGVLIEPGSAFFDRPPRPCPFLRLRLSSIRSDRIEEGVRAMALAFKDYAANCAAR